MMVWRRLRSTSRTTAGVMLVLTFTIVATGVYSKDRVTSIMTGVVHPSRTISAEFQRDYKLRENLSDVKIGGVVVGTVTDVAPTEQGTSDVTMQLREGVLEKLGGSPSAGIRPATLLGGKYYVDLRPGGGGKFTDERIPRQRTTIPVELDRVLSTLTPPARDGMRAGTKQLDKILANGGSQALRDLVADAPETFRPAGTALEAMRGTRPARDLTELVTGMRAIGDAMTRRQGQTEEIIESLDRSLTAMADARRPLTRSVRTMPETLRTTRAGMADLQPTLDRLVTTAANFRPSARELDSLLTELDPVLARTRPLLGELRPLLRDLHPLTERLVPVTRETTRMLDDLRGPVLDRVGGPITDMIMSPWRGSGEYEGGGASGNRLYEELGYLTSRASQVYGWHDNNSAFSRMSLGMGANSVGGFGKSVEQYLELLGLRQPPGPQPGDGAAPPLSFEEPGGAK